MLLKIEMKRLRGKLCDQERRILRICLDTWPTNDADRPLPGACAGKSVKFCGSVSLHFPSFGRKIFPGFHANIIVADSDSKKACRSI